MSWIQLGTRKINTTQICFLEQDGERVKIYFHGNGPGNPVELDSDASAKFWKFMKAEDVLMAKDKGSATVLPRLQSARMMDVPAKPIGTPAPAGAPSSSAPHTPVHKSVPSAPKPVAPMPKSH
ncbi:MAG TPA: hypothetical protein VHD56_08640 [Tepidisphaeraceae bacterium]|nr:hypothetical protein [Tepidisphaeraceae bacterium]